MKRRLTAAQALVTHLQNQYSERDGKEYRFIQGCFGIFGHGNVGGIGQALEQDSTLRYYLCRNEQAIVIGHEPGWAFCLFAPEAAVD